VRLDDLAKELNTGEKLQILDGKILVQIAPPQLHTLILMSDWCSKD